MATALIFSGSAGYAADGFYVSVQGGGTFLLNTDLEDTSGTLVGLGTDVDFDAGYNVGGSLGYEFSLTDYQYANNFRVEAEISFRTNEIDTVTVLGLATPGNGDVNAVTLLGNLFYDINTRSAWKPYVGVGIGTAFVDFDAPSLAGRPIDDDDTVFAYQLGAGVGYELIEHMTVSMGYRFLGMLDPDFAVSGVPVNTEYTSHDVGVSVRFGF